MDDTVSGQITRGYDGLDRLTSETTPQGSVSYTYDNAGRRATMTVGGQAAITYGYDNADRLTSITQGTATVGFVYDHANRTTQVTLPNNLLMVYDYDNANQVTGITYKQGSTTLGNLTYAYDNAGRRTTVGGTWARSGLPVAAPAAGISLNANNQALTFAGTTMTYDLNGNLATAQDASGIATYTWDVRNRLTSLTAPGFNATFAYDAIGRRTGKTVQGVTTNFVYDGLNPVQEKNGSTVTANLLTGLGIDQLFTRTDGSGTSEFFTDALGSTVALANPSGAVQTSYTYELFGATTQTGSANTNSYKYTGREDDGTGLMYYRARYYSPRLQRFISEDPIGFSGGDVNLYGYVRNAPSIAIDPMGLEGVPLGPGMAPGPPIGWYPFAGSPPVGQPLPPGWDPSWTWRYPEGNGGPRWFDPKGGEWRYHPPDRHHPGKPHYDYNPHDAKYSPWRNEPLDPMNCPAENPKPAPIPPLRGLQPFILFPWQIPFILNPGGGGGVPPA